MRKSVFFKFALIIIPIVLIFEMAEVYFSYRTIYNETLETSKKTVVNIAKEAADEFMYYNPNDSKDRENCSKEFDDLCKTHGVTYIFAIEPDLDTRDEKYIAIGFGENASERAKKTRYPGVIVKGTLSDDEIKVYNGVKQHAVIHEVNEFDDTLICYYPVSNYYDYSNDSFVTFDKPMLIGAEISLKTISKNTAQKLSRTGAIQILFSSLTLALVFFVLYFRISGPVRKISTRMKNFVSDRDKEFEKLPVKGRDELAEMSNSFNIMAEEIDNYIESIDNYTKEKHRNEAELDIARTIQNGLIKPPQYCDDAVSINAYMQAAKNVGGDLYEYQILKDGRVYFVIADVSGKGIIASLFMSRAITLLHQYALMEYSPAKMLYTFNNTLAEQNPKGLFITAFAAIYDPGAGTLTYSNAGHNRPYIISDNELIMLDGAAGVAAGVFSDNEYTQETVKLKPDDVIFLYTDGVNEAESNSGEMFGTDRLENELKKHIGKISDNICDDVLESVKEFTEGAVQNDDITVLALRVKPKAESKKVTFDADTKNLVLLKDMIMNEQGIPEETKALLRLIAEEIFVNICYYAYDNGEGDITVELKVNSDGATIIFTDTGKPFDPTVDVVKIEEYDHENSIGGLGRFLAFEMADESSYAYEDNKNKLTITKYFNSNQNYGGAL